MKKKGKNRERRDLDKAGRDQGKEHGKREAGVTGEKSVPCPRDNEERHR